MGKNKIKEISKKVYDILINKIGEKEYNNIYLGFDDLVDTVDSYIKEKIDEPDDIAGNIIVNYNDFKKESLNKQAQDAFEETMDLVYKKYTEEDIYETLEEKGYTEEDIGRALELAREVIGERSLGIG